MEIWKDVVGYEGRYKVSSSGQIKSLQKGMIMRPRLINSGYLVIHLRDGKCRKGKLVHRVVAEAFCENPNGYTQVNHKDENKNNNAADNLEWVSPKVNTNYGTGKQRANIKKSKPVVMLSDSGDVLGVFSSATDAARKTNIAQGTITNVCRGRHERAGGYKWEYLNAGIART